MGLVRLRLQRGADDMGAAGGEAQPRDRRPRVRRANAARRARTSAGTSIDAARVGHRARQRLALGRGRDQPERVAQPLDQAAGDEHRAFERISALAAQLPRDRGQQPVARDRRLVAGMGEHEGAGAVGRLGLARAEAGLADRRRLLVAGHAAERDRRAEQRRSRHSARRNRRSRAAPPPARRTGRAALRPSRPAWMSIKRGARGVGRVGDVQAAGQLEDQPGFDRADAEILARLAQRRPLLASPRRSWWR